MPIPLSTGTPPTMKDYTTPHMPTWCEECGNYGIWTALKRTLVESKIPPTQVFLCYDVGCHGNMADKIGGYRFHGLHGRVIPFAAGAKLANPRIPVIAVGGDGASFSEGVGHLVHAIRSNYPIVFILHNNANYGLTTGQASALTPRGQKMNTSPNGIPERTLPSMDFVFSLEPTFVARAFSGDIPQMVKVFQAALTHRGFAYVDVLQACPSYNHFATHEFLLGKCHDVAATAHDPKDFAAARRLAVDTAEKIATGVLYRNEDVPDFYEELAARKGRDTTAVDEVRLYDVGDIMRDFV